MDRTLMKHEIGDRILRALQEKEDLSVSEAHSIIFGLLCSITIAAAPDENALDDMIGAITKDLEKNRKSMHEKYRLKVWKRNEKN